MESGADTVMNKIRSLFRKSWFIVLLGALPVFFNILSGRAQHTHPEANCFIIIYNHPGLPLLKLIFDPLRTDWQNYQGRELSYLIDFLDARFIALCIRMGKAHFYSLSAIIFLLAGVLVIHRGLKKLYPEKSPFLIALPPLMYAFSNASNLVFFRSSKPAAAFGIIILFFHLAKLLKFPEKFRNFPSHIIALITLFLLPQLDRQGFFAAAVIAGATASLLLLSSTPAAEFFELTPEHRKPLLFTAASATAGTLFSILSNFVIVPKIIFALNHYHPDFSFQRLPEGSLFNIVPGYNYLLENIGYNVTTATGMAALLAGTLVVMVMLWNCLILCKKGKLSKITFYSFAATLMLMMICSGIMAMRHPSIMLLDVIYGGYFQPFSAVLCGFAGLFIMETPEAESFFKFLCLLATGVIISGILHVSGLRSIPGNDEGHLFLHKSTTHKTIEMLNDPQLKQSVPMPFSSMQVIYFFRNQKKDLLQLEIDNPKYEYK